MEEWIKKPNREEVCPGKKDKLDLQTARVQIANSSGPEYWRSLEELAGSSEFQEMLHREFPKGASEWLDSVSRRGFLKLMGASLAMAGMTACTKQPLEPIVPYVKQPEEVVPELGVAGFGFAPRLPQADGRIAGHGGHDRLHQAAAGTDCSLRKAAGRSGSRARSGWIRFRAAASSS